MARPLKQLRIAGAGSNGVDRVFVLVADLESGPGITAYQQTIDGRPRMSIAQAKQLRKDLDRAIEFLERK